MSKDSQPEPEAPETMEAEAREERGEKQRKQKNRLLKDVSRVFLIIGFFAVVSYLFQIPTVRESLVNPQKIREALHPDGSLQSTVQSSITFLVCSAMLVAFGMPRIWVSVVAGVVFGAALGTLLSNAAATIGASGTYLLGRSLLRSMVRERMGKRIKVWTRRFQENAFMWTLYARLFPVSNASLTSLICGCCKVPQDKFILANFLGFLPLSAVFSTLGSSLNKGGLQIAIGAVLFVLTMGIQWWYTRRKGASAEEKGD